jgi:hypothetical protein
MNIDSLFKDEMKEMFINEIISKIHQEPTEFKIKPHEREIFHFYFHLIY